LKNNNTYFIVFVILLLASCDKEDTNQNPYNNRPEVQEETSTLNSIPPDNFAALHQNIFSKTCANSGCHDGTFEPDFRSIESSYYTLVNHPVITNDQAGSFDYRVFPGNSSASLLYERLTTFIPNTSGIMPLEVDPGSDWEQKKDQYMNDIKTWIDGGAHDMFGNPPHNP